MRNCFFVLFCVRLACLSCTGLHFRHTLGDIWFQRLPDGLFVPSLGPWGFSVLTHLSSTLLDCRQSEKKEVQPFLTKKGEWTTFFLLSHTCDVAWGMAKLQVCQSGPEWKISTTGSQIDRIDCPKMLCPAQDRRNVCLLLLFGHKVALVQYFRIRLLLADYFSSIIKDK